MSLDPRSNDEALELFDLHIAPELELRDEGKDGDLEFKQSEGPSEASAWTIKARSSMSVSRISIQIDGAGYVPLTLR